MPTYIRTHSPSAAEVILLLSHLQLVQHIQSKHIDMLFTLAFLRWVEFIDAINIREVARYRFHPLIIVIRTSCIVDQR